MNLVIDIGNTRTKLSVFHHGEVLITVPFDEFQPEFIDVLKKEHPSLNRAILSSVKKLESGFVHSLKTKFNTFIQLDETTPLPFENRYQSKETLGYDRIAAVAGAHSLYPGTDVLVIDAGTAITYDLLTREGDYLGGNISPGLSMRFKALHQFTDKLPLEDPDNAQLLFGRTTGEAIRTGVQQGILYEVDKTIEAFKEIYKNLKVIITGGDVKFFDLKLKNSFFVHFNLTAFGLNSILEHNGEIKKR